MFGLGIPEIVIIVVVLGIVVFGAKKLGGLAKSAGRFSGEFKKGKLEMESELKKVKEEFKNSETQAQTSNQPQSEEQPITQPSENQ